MPKLKSHRGASKRLKVTGSGKIMIKRAGTSHLLTKKSRKKKRNLKETVVANLSDNRKLKRLLGL
ncbi:MAG: 50S ribosomal protein L35 [Nitrospirota bacterium]